LNNCGYETVKPTNTYRRFHEVFSNQVENIPYTELIEHFLRLRNVVAAHGNQNPPEQYKIIEDNTFEIQLFLEHLINNVVFKD